MIHDWGIDPPTLSGILWSAWQQLIDEITDDTPFSISAYHRDGRNDIEYIYDLIDGRIIERCLTTWFAVTKKRKVVRVGSDADDKIVRIKGEKITSRFDLLDLETGIKIEVQMSTKVRDVYHIKKNKGDRMVREGGCLMFIILSTNEYFLVEGEDLIGCDVAPNPRFGGKVCYWVYPKKLFNMREER